MFFDRDGVLNKADIRDGLPYPPRLSDIVLEDDAQPAVAMLSRIVSLLFVVSNQPDVARGTLARSDVELANRYVGDRLPMTAFYTCYHDDSDKCDCRKPAAGLLLRAARDFDVDLQRSYMVGDRWRDIDAGHAAGATTIFIDRGYAEPSPRDRAHITVSSTSEAVAAIIRAEASCGLPPETRDHESAIRITR